MLSQFVNSPNSLPSSFALFKMECFRKTLTQLELFQNPTAYVQSIHFFKEQAISKYVVNSSPSNDEVSQVNTFCKEKYIKYSQF